MNTIGYLKTYLEKQIVSLVLEGFGFSYYFCHQRGESYGAGNSIPAKALSIKQTFVLCNGASVLRKRLKKDNRTT